MCLKNKDLLDIIQQIFAQNKGRYGARRVHNELVNRGYVVNHKRVQRIMHEAGLFGKRPKEKYRSYKGKVGKIADNLINRNFTASAPFQKWTTDISQFSFPWGKYYLSPILDMNTNEIISYDLSTSSLRSLRKQLKNIFTIATTNGFRKNKMDAVCKIQDGIHIFHIIKKCV